MMPLGLACIGRYTLPVFMVRQRWRFKCIRQVAPICTPSSASFAGPTGVHIPNGFSWFSRFCRAHPGWLGNRGRWTGVCLSVSVTWESSCCCYATNLYYCVRFSNIFVIIMKSSLKIPLHLEPLPSPNDVNFLVKCVALCWLNDLWPNVLHHPI